MNKIINSEDIPTFDKFIEQLKYNKKATAQEILDRTIKRKPSPTVNVEYIEEGFKKNRIAKSPDIGIHPRVLFSPEEVPGIKERLLNTITGKMLLENLRDRTNKSIKKSGTWENLLLEKLAEGDIDSASKLFENPMPTITGHYQPAFIYPMTLDALDSLIFNNVEQGRKIASALEGYAKYLEPKLDELNKGPYAEQDGPSGTQALMSQQLIGYCYDFMYNFMTDEQRNNVRRLISKATKGKYTHGMELPPHWRNWNWVNCNQQFVLLALSIEGEEGYDPRIYSNGIEVMRDFFDYGISPKGVSREAAGYCQFGFVWAMPFMMSAAKRGDNLFYHSHFQNIKYWHLNCIQPFGNEWMSHGDCAAGSPGFHFVQPMKFYFPQDDIIDYVWGNTIHSSDYQLGDARNENVELITALLCAEDELLDKNGLRAEYNFGASLEQPNTFFDDSRGLLVTRNEWSKDAMVMQFECRVDSVSSSHEHADRGNFTLSALGRAWAVDGFRAVETKYHNCVIIDGKGQGYYAPPGKWIGTWDTEDATFGCCDSKNAYDAFWPKTIIATTQIDDPKLESDRWRYYKEPIIKFNDIYKDIKKELDPSENVVKYYNGYLDGNPLMWDEDTWPVRIEHNIIKRAYRTAGLVRGNHCYSLIVDDIQKDDQERLYEWIMMTKCDTDIVSICGNDIILGGIQNKEQPQKGDPQLLVRILQIADPEKPQDYSTRPNHRLETFEKKEAFDPDDQVSCHYNMNGRTYGIDKRLVIGSRSVAPNFKIMLFPFRYGDALPTTKWDDSFKKLYIKWDDQQDEFEFNLDGSGRTRVAMHRKGKIIINT